MKKVMSLMLTVFSLCILISCSDKDEETEEFIEYNNDKWVPIINQFNEQIEEPRKRATRLISEGKNEEAITVMEDEMLPIINESQNQFDDVELKHKKIKRLNDLEIESEEFLKDRVKKLISYLKGGDVSEQEIQYNEETGEKAQEVVDYRNELIDKYNLEYVEEDESLGSLRNLQRKEE